MRKAVRAMSAVLFALPSMAATEFNLTFNTAAPGGSYKPKNVATVWVSTSGGVFVRTICRWGSSHANVMLSWKAASGGTSADADAVMGATRPSHTIPTPVSATWDLKNKSGVVVPDGTYNINFECADGSRQTYTGQFVKNGVAGTRTLPGNTCFTGITIVYAPPTAANTPPVAQAQSVSLPQNTSRTITLAATDADGNPLTYAVVTAQVHGTLSGAAPSLTYTPAANYSGADSFTFKANDGTVDSAPATVSITVTAVNRAPVARSQYVSLVQDVPKAIALAATDADGNPLRYRIVTQPAHGALSGSAPNVTFTPAAGYVGSDRFTFVANDGTADSAPATVSITVTAVNRAPVAQAQSVSLPQNTSRAITLAATDPDGNPLTYAVVTAPVHGTLSGAAPSLTYTPAANYSGEIGRAHV